MKTGLATATIFALSRILSHASVVVNWGGDYVGGPTAFSRNEAFSDTASLNPSSGYAGTSGTFYGGAQLAGTASGFETTGGDPNVYTTGITNFGSSDRISFRWLGRHGATTQGSIVWNRSDFLNVGSDSTVLFDSSSSLSITIPDVPVTTRWLVRDGGTYYVSSANFDNGSLTLTDPNSATTWAPFAPATNLDFNAATATFASHTFNDVRAIGYYFEAESQENALYLYGVTNFSATAFVVPEPTSGVLALFGAASIARRRR